MSVPAQQRRTLNPRVLAAYALACVAIGLIACNGCRSSQTPSAPSAQAQPDVGAPTVRLYLVSDVAGVFEPCGCTKDQLGGIDHVAAWMASERAKAPASLAVAAGPMFYIDKAIKPDRAEQEQAKADLIARSMKTLGLAAFAPGQNDWAGGDARLLALVQTSGAAMLAPGHAEMLREVNGVKIGLIGVGPASGTSGDAGKRADLVRASIESLKKQGAQVLVALAAVGRGEAKRIADVAPELTAIVVGSEAQVGEQNTTASPGERVNGVVIAQGANHLQSIAVLDLYVRDGSTQFADASGLEEARKREELTRRIDDLHVKISNWERDGKVSKADLDARRADALRLEKELAALDVRPPPPQGSFFRFTMKEIRESLGKDPGVGAELLAYYKQVNERNKQLFADRMPLPVAPGQASYTGAEACASCHPNAKKFWEGTKHARAYATLVDQSKEFNLDCVSCHVTGYDQPGGSTVTHVEKLQNVQCENCHGPGSKHAQKPDDKSLITAMPRPETCTGCHHPPHVEQFDPNAKRGEIIGPGHGQKM